MKDWPDPQAPQRDRRPSRAYRVEMIVIALLMLFVAASAWAKRPPVPPKGTTFTCTAIAVWDGDGPIWCKEGPRIRLAGINARELDNSCRKGARCPAMSGIEARDVLVNLLGGPKGVLPSGHVAVQETLLTCTSLGKEKYRRTLALCRKDRDLSITMVRLGAAY